MPFLCLRLSRHPCHPRYPCHYDENAVPPPTPAIKRCVVRALRARATHLKPGGGENPAPEISIGRFHPLWCPLGTWRFPPPRESRAARTIRASCPHLMPGHFYGKPIGGHPSYQETAHTAPCPSGFPCKRERPIVFAGAIPKTIRSVVNICCPAGLRPASSCTPAANP